MDSSISVSSTIRRQSLKPNISRLNVSGAGLNRFLSRFSYFKLDGLRMSRPSHSSSCHSTFSLQTSNRFRRESASSGYRPSLQQNTLWKHSGSIMCDILGLQCWKFMYIDFRLVSAFSRLRSPFSSATPSSVLLSHPLLQYISSFFKKYCN